MARRSRIPLRYAHGSRGAGSPARRAHALLLREQAEPLRGALCRAAFMICFIINLSACSMEEQERCLRYRTDDTETIR